MRRTGRTIAAARTSLQTSSESSAYSVPIGAERRGAQWVAERLREAIAGGAYEHGRRLPAERQIADAFSVSRGTVREALKLLHEHGVVERRVRIGTFVTTGRRHAEEDVAEITSPLELMEVRQAIEPQIVRLVVLNAKPRDIARIAQALHELERADDRQTFSEWDQRFHLAMAEGTHNPLMIEIYHQINHVRGHAQWQAIKDKVLTPERVQAYNREHRALFEAIRSRDADAALAIVFAHLQSARSDLSTG
jgi:DNA-binding FadR family transcriptional regulator